MFLHFYILIIWTVATVISIIPLRRFEEEKERNGIDQPGDDALEILLTGATFYKDINGVGIYVKRGDRLDAQMDWYLMKLRGMIHYTDGSAAAIVGTRHVSIHNMPARITISGRNSIIPRKVFYYRPKPIQI